jgi:hypothetical protein
VWQKIDALHLHIILPGLWLNILPPARIPVTSTGRSLRGNVLPGEESCVRCCFWQPPWLLFRAQPVATVSAIAVAVAAACLVSACWDTVSRLMRRRLSAARSL